VPAQDIEEGAGSGQSAGDNLVVFVKALKAANPSIIITQVKHPTTPIIIIIITIILITQMISSAQNPPPTRHVQQARPWVNHVTGGIEGTTPTFTKEKTPRDFASGAWLIEGVVWCVAACVRLSAGCGDPDERECGVGQDGQGTGPARRHRHHGQC
jgi:hypothetical protein